jgi:hypothetical protein
MNTPEIFLSVAAIVQIACFVRVLAYFFQTEDERHIAVYSLLFTLICGFGVILAFMAGWGPIPLRRTMYCWLLTLVVQIFTAVAILAVGY